MTCTYNQGLYRDPVIMEVNKVFDQVEAISM